MHAFKNISSAFLLTLVIGALAASFLLFRPFATVILLAAVLAAIFYPAFLALKRRLRSTNLAAAISCLLVIFCFVLPVALIISLLVKQTLDLYLVSERLVVNGEFAEFFSWISALPIIGKAGDFFQNFVLEENLDLVGRVAGAAQSVSSWLVTQTTTALSSIAALVGKFFLLIFSIFYFFKDGAKFLKRIVHLSPLAAKHETEIFQKFLDASQSVLFGTFGTAVAQGVLGGIGFAIVGLQALVWGVAMAFFSLVPAIGTAMIWLPAAIFLFFLGKAGAAIFLLVWGVAVIGTADNFLRPILMKGKMEIHTLVIFFSILGGLSSFGFLGIIFGPLLVALAATVLHIYELEYHDLLVEEDRDSGVMAAEHRRKLVVEE